MKKVYIVTSTNDYKGYDLLAEKDIVSTFSSRKKAIAFLNSEKKRILKENEGDINILSDIDNDHYFFAEKSDRSWFEVLMIEREVQ